MSLVMILSSLLAVAIAAPASTFPAFSIFLSSPDSLSPDARIFPSYSIGTAKLSIDYSAPLSSHAGRWCILSELEGNFLGYSYLLELRLQ